MHGLRFLQIFTYNVSIVLIHTGTVQSTTIIVTMILIPMFFYLKIAIQVSGPAVIVWA